jgi:hypothetical protein
MSDEHEHNEGEHAEGHDKPRPDDSPPQNALIFFYTVLVVASLVGLKFVFDSFLDSSRREVRTEMLDESLSSERLAAHRDEVRERLSGENSIDETIANLAERGRGAFPQIRPFPSEDRGARDGWARRAPAEPAVTPEPSAATGR